MKTSEAANRFSKLQNLTHSSRIRQSIVWLEPNFTFPPDTRGQSLDMIINNLESAAAKTDVGQESRDMPGEGVRRLAAKLRRKLHKTPPRWQVLLVPCQYTRMPLCCPCCRQQYFFKGGVLDLPP